MIGARRPTHLEIKKKKWGDPHKNRGRALITRSLLFNFFFQFPPTCCSWFGKSFRWKQLIKKPEAGNYGPFDDLWTSTSHQRASVFHPWIKLFTFASKTRGIQSLLQCKFRLENVHYCLLDTQIRWVFCEGSFSTSKMLQVNTKRNTCPFLVPKASYFFTWEGCILHSQCRSSQQHSDFYIFIFITFICGSSRI